MKYSDEQRIKKIYENAVKLHNYIVENNIKKEELLTSTPLQWLVTLLYTILVNMFIICLIITKKQMIIFHG